MTISRQRTITISKNQHSDKRLRQRRKKFCRPRSRSRASWMLRRLNQSRRSVSWRINLTKLKPTRTHRKARSQKYKLIQMLPKLKQLRKRKKLEPLNKASNQPSKNLTNFTRSNKKNLTNSKRKRTQQLPTTRPKFQNCKRAINKNSNRRMKTSQMQTK